MNRGLLDVEETPGPSNILGGDGGREKKKRRGMLPDWISCR